MFGLPSLQKLIVLAAIVAAVWYGYKFLGRLQEVRKAEAKLHQQREARQARASQQRQAEKSSAGRVEDLVPCPKCGAYIRAGSTCSCGHKG